MRTFPLNTYNIADGDNVKITYDGTIFTIIKNDGVGYTRPKTLNTSNIYFRVNAGDTIRNIRCFGYFVL